MTDTDFNLKIKVRSGRLIKAMRAAGIETAAELSRASGAHYTAVIDLINMQATPYSRRKGEVWRENATLIAAAVNAMPDDLWPEHLRDVKPRREGAELELSGPELAAVMDAAPSIEQITMDRSDVAALMETIPERNAEAVRLRFGIGCGEHSLKEIGEILGTGSARAGQIVEKGLRLMRHPKRTSQIYAGPERPRALPKPEFPVMVEAGTTLVEALAERAPHRTGPTSWEEREERKARWRARDEASAEARHESDKALVRLVQWENDTVAPSWKTVTALIGAGLAVVEHRFDGKYLELTDAGREALAA